LKHIMMEVRLNTGQELRHLDGLSTARSVSHSNLLLKLNPHPQKPKELRQPIRMSWPSRRGHQITIDMRLIHWHINPSSTGAFHLSRDRRICGTGLAFNNISGGQDLQAMANRCYRLIRLSEMPHHLEDKLIEP